MNLNTATQLILLIFGGGLLIQVIRLSFKLGELCTKVDVLWHAMTNDLELNLEERLRAKRSRDGDSFGS